MNARIVNDLLDLVELQARSKPSPPEFETAYQALVATERIRFAIKHTEQFAPRTDQTRKVGLQLLDALERLESAERHFQSRFRAPRITRNRVTDESLNGESAKTDAGLSVGEWFPSH